MNILYSNNISLYVDPGTGGLIISSLTGIISIILSFLVGLFGSFFIKRPQKWLSKFWNVIKNHKGKIFFAFIIIMSAFILFNYLHQTGNAKDKKILLLGLDGFCPKVMEKLMEEGKLHNFQRLKEIGSYTRMETTIPPETPVATSALATGTNPGKFGVFDFLSRDPSTYLLKLNLAEEIKGITGTTYRSTCKGTPFWEITSQNNIPTTVIRWPLTFPPKKIKGKMLSGLGTIDIKGFLNSYRFYTSESYDEETEGAQKIIKVEKKEDIIQTHLFGPSKMQDKERKEITTPMKIKILSEHSILLDVGENQYTLNLNNWSDWIRVKFKIGLWQNIYGIFKAHLFSINPEFKMYITSIQIDPKTPVKDISYPSDYAKELSKKIGLFYTLGMPEDTKALDDHKITKKVFLEQIKQIEEEREKMFWYEFEKFNKGVLAVYFDASDRFQHIFYREEKIPPVIEDFYLDKDRFLGEILKHLDDKTYLIVFSDHGFGSFKRKVNINTWLYKNGYLNLTQEISQQNKGELFEYVDWQNTKAYALGFASIYINLEGREKQGIIKEDEKDQLVNEIIEKLSQLKDPQTGNKVITKLYKKDEIYSGFYLKESPEIIIGFSPGYRMSEESALGGFTKEIINENNKEWQADHLIDRSHVPAILFTNFKIKNKNPSVMDIAPTILDLFGLKIPEEMDGKSLI